MGVDDDAMILAPALVPEKGEQPMTRTRHRNSGLRKRCGCSRKVWPKCPHSWFLNFKPRGGPPYRLSLDRELGRRVESKSEAEAAATMIRAAILAGTFHASTSTPNAAASLTFGDVAVRYLDAYVRSRLRPRSVEQAKYHLAALQRAEIPGANGALVRLADKPIESVTKADVEAVRALRRVRGIVGTNRLLERLRHLFNWAIGEGHIERTPFKRGGVTVVKLEKAAEQPRHRRLESGEEEALLAHAGPHLYALIVAALETGCRVGELLSLQGLANPRPEGSWLHGSLAEGPLDGARRRVKGPLPEHQSALPRSSSRVRQSTEGSARHLGPRGPRLAGPREHHDNVPLSGNDAHNAPAGAEEIRATSLPLHKRCTNGSTRDSARLRRKLATPTVIGG
jgi:integrase